MEPQQEAAVIHLAEDDQMAREVARMRAKMAAQLGATSASESGSNESDLQALPASSTSD